MSASWACIPPRVLHSIHLGCAAVFYRLEVFCGSARIRPLPLLRSPWTQPKAYPDAREKPAPYRRGDGWWNFSESDLEP